MANQVLFWNVQRSGKNQEKLSKFMEVLSAIYATCSRGDLLVIFCEVTSSVNNVQMNSIYNKSVSTQFNLIKAINTNTHSLGYSAFTIHKNRNITLNTINVEPTLTLPQIFGHPASYYGIKGGSTFYKKGKQSNRKVGRVANTDVYVIHSLASAKAKHLTPWAASSIGHTNNQFLLVGDFNCEPKDINNNLVGPNIVGNWGSKTHNAFSGLKSTYDYAIYKGYQKCKVTTMDYKKLFWVKGFEYISDHLPVLVQYA